jgi:hypothetical protein
MTRRPSLTFPLLTLIIMSAAYLWVLSKVV